jgi:hypothetical protein
MKELDNITYKIAEIKGKRNDVPFIMSARETAIEIRATFLRRDFDKNLRYRQSSIQNLGNIPLEKVSTTEFTILSRVCRLKRSKVKIPEPIETKHVTHWMYIGSPDGSPEFQLNTQFNLEYAAEQAFPNIFPSYFFKDQYLYVADYEGGFVNIKTMFRDPREAARFAAYPNSDCSVETKAYIPKDIVHDIELEMFRKYSVSQEEQDKVNKDQIEL